MSLSRRNPRRDSVEPSIVQALRAAGWSVAQWSARDCPDLVCAKWGRIVLIHVKTGKAQLKPGQRKWIQAWHGSPVFTLRSVADALALNASVVQGEAIR